MRLTSSLSIRVAFAFAYQGAFFSLLLVGSLYLAIQHIGHEIMDQSLQAELDQALEMRAHGEAFDILNSVTLQGYLRSEKTSDIPVPAVVAKLEPGHHNVTMNDIDYRVLVADAQGGRYFLLFNTDQQHERESELLRFLSIAAFVLTGISAVLGFWLALRIVTPVSRLARQVGQAQPEEIDLTLAKLTRDDEVGELARAFDRYARRVHSFIQREKQFTGDISHELRTPLAIIMAALEVLERDQRVLEIQGPRIERMKRAVLETTELCKALLLLAREKVVATDESSYAVAEVIRNCIEQHKHLLNRDRVELEVEFVADPHMIVEPTLLAIVIGNLLRNAFSYTHSGKIIVRLEAERFSVQDTGIGIHNAEIDRVFELHYRGSSSTGEGVGLSLVKRICDRFDWSISISSQEGEGTLAQVQFSKIQQLTNF
jgi:signal transduction histidine kinase